jgi:competence protein ComEC
VNVLIVLVITFLTGIGTGTYLPTPFWAGLTAISIGCILVVTSIHTRRLLIPSFIVAVFAIGWARVPDTTFKSLEVFAPCERVVEGKVTQPPTKIDDRQRITIEIQSWSKCLSGAQFNGLTPAHGRLYLSINSNIPPTVRRGDTVRLRGRIKPIVPRRNPGRQIYRTNSQLYSTTLPNPKSVARIENAPTSIRYVFDILRRDLATFWHKALPRETALLARALTLGESTVLDPDQRERFRNTGTAHLLSVSGLHLGLAVVLVFFIFFRLLLRSYSLTSRLDVGRIAALLTIPAALAFTLLAGCREPVVRACVMVVSALIARALGRPKGTAEALAIAAMGLVVYDPTMLGRPGFQLSFVAVLAFVSVLGRNKQTPIVDKEEPCFPETKPSPIDPLVRTIKKNVLRLFLSTLAATAATTPIAMYHFGYVSLVAIPANMVAVPFTSIFVMPGLLAVLVLAGPFPGIATLALGIVKIPLVLLDQFLKEVAKLPCTIEDPPALLFWAIVFACLGALLLTGRLRRAGIGLVLLSTILALASVLFSPPRLAKGRLTIDFFDVGHGDSILVTFPNESHWLVDTGGTMGSRYDVGEQIVVPTLRALGVDHLETLIITHPDYDHVGGAPAVLKTIGVGTLWENGQGSIEGATPSYNEALAEARRKKVIIRHTPQICRRHKIGGAYISVIHPCFGEKPYDSGLSFNDNSIVLLIEYGLVRIVLPGDIEYATETALVERNLFPKIDVLKLPHHGSRTSSSSQLLDATMPAFGIASTGPFSRHGIPHQEVIDRLAARSIRLFRTDQDGAIRLVTDGHHIKISPTVLR